VSFEKTPDRIHVWVVNDSPQPVSGALLVRRLDFDGRSLGQANTEVNLKSGEARRCLDTTALGEISLRSQFLHASFAGNESTSLLSGERYLHLPQATLTARLANDRLEIATDAFARQVTLDFTGVTGAVFEDNFFDLIPGQKRTVTVRKAAGGTALIIRALNAEPIRLVWKP
jgi:beta-mannosidase